MLWFHEWLIRVLKYLEATGTCSNISFFHHFFTLIYEYTITCSNISFFHHFFFTLIYDYTITCSNISFFSSFFHINI